MIDLTTVAREAGEERGLRLSHDRIWLHVLAHREARVANGRSLATAGPLTPEPGVPYRARFIESIFTPGMRTRTR
jgi:hypothetical protein